MVSVTAWMGFFRKKHTGVGRVEDMEIPGAKKRSLQEWSRKNHVEFSQVLDVGLGISNGCNTIFGNSGVEASFCLEFLAVK